MASQVITIINESSWDSLKAGNKISPFVSSIRFRVRQVEFPHLPETCTCHTCFISFSRWELPQLSTLNQLRRFIQNPRYGRNDCMHIRSVLIQIGSRILTYLTCKLDGIHRYFFTFSASSLWCAQFDIPTSILQDLPNVLYLGGAGWGSHNTRAESGRRKGQ